MPADPNILRTQTPDQINPAQASPSVEDIQLPEDHAGNHPDPKVQERPREIFSTPLTDAVTEDAEGRKLINPVPDTVEGLPEASKVTQVVDPQTGVRRFVVDQTVETGYRPPVAPSAAPEEKKSRKGLWIAVTAAGTAAVAGLVFLFQGGGSAEQRVNSEHDNQGDTKATSQAAAPTAAEASATSAAETQEASAEVNYTIDTVAANTDPEKYYAGYAEKLGMKYADVKALDKYFELSDAGKSGTLDQATAGAEMKTFLEEQLGGNFSLLANALYKNPDLTPKEQADLVAQLAPYVFDTDGNPQLEADVKRFAGNIVVAGKADSSRGTLKAYVSSGASLGEETTSFLAVYRVDDNGKPDDNFNGPAIADESNSSVYLVARPGSTNGSSTSHFALRQYVPS